MIGGDPFLFLVTALFLVPAAVVAIPVHELGHALAAYWQGDRTPRNRGYFSLNPRLFIEPYGLLAVFFLKVAWGRPVPVNEYKLRGVWGRLAYALGGPVANLLVAALFGTVIRYMLSVGIGFNFASLIQTPAGYLMYIVFAIFFLNLSTFAFQLLPVPGLDGWRVLEAVLRGRYPRFFFDAGSRRREIWMICVLVLVVGSFVAGNLLNVVLTPFYAPASRLILGACIGYPGLAPCPPSGLL